MAKQSKVEAFVNTVQEQDQQVIDARNDMTDEIVAHMLKLPGLGVMFKHADDRQLFATQCAIFIENAVRQQAMNQRARAEFEAQVEQLDEEERQRMQAADNK